MARTKKKGRKESSGGSPRAPKNNSMLDDAPEPEEKKQKTTNAPAPGILEAGKIYFLYRPRVGVQEANRLSDVQRFYLILAPEKSSKKRLIVIGKKKLPAPRERYFGFVEAVAEKMADLTEGMGPVDNQTKTRGVRHTEAARIAGEGEYSIAEKDGSRTYLIWRLEIPSKPGDVQHGLCIGKEGTLVISIKNPKKANPGGNVGLSTKADFGEKQQLFEGTPGGYAWIAAEDPTLLDYQNAEILLIGAGEDIKARLGGEVEEHIKEKAEDVVEEAAAEGIDEDEEEAKLVEEMKKELAGGSCVENKLEDAPAETGEWK